MIPEKIITERRNNMRLEIPIEGSQNQSQEVANIFLTGQIDTDMATNIASTLLEIEGRNQSIGVFDPIQMIINTPGGDLYATWMICDIMSSMQTPIHVVGLGQVASGGFLIFMNGSKGHRTATTNTQFMTHRYIMAFEANHANIISQRPELDRIHDRIVNHYKKCTSLSIKDIEKHLLTEHDVWLTADQCLELGVCDNVVETTNLVGKKRKIRIKDNMSVVKEKLSKVRKNAKSK
jgi:ATP-dependent Clp protease, protease subunit